MVAVKLELAQPDADSPDSGSVECSVDCWGLGSAQLHGRNASDINAELTDSLNR